MRIACFSKPTSNSDSFWYPVFDHMKTRILRFLLPAILVAAGAGSVAWTWALAQHVDRLESTGKQSAARIDRLDGLLDELARDELTYVASGQIDKETLTATSARLRQMISESTWLLGQSLAGAARPAGALAEGVASLAEVDARARENMRADLDLMAADLLFTETTRTRQALRDQLRALRVAESNAVADGRANDLKQAWTVLAGVALLFACALVRSSSRRLPPPESNEPPIVTPDTDHVALNIAPPKVAEPSIDLTETAALCSAISRLKSEADVQGLLVRTASLLEASGVVVWMAAGDEMFPVAWHGYDSKQLLQLGPIGRSSLNATAAAWRTGALQSVAGGATSQSAIVVPLLGVERCIGVLAIEVAPGREAEVAVQAVVTLIAAQLVTVLGAWPAGSSVPPAEVLPFERLTASNSS
jgi:hypothetical protein